MDEVSEKEFEEARESIPEKKPVEIESDEDFEEALKQMENPVDSLKELAVKIKRYLDKRIKKEEESEKGILTDHTRRWIESYQKILEKIQKALHGDKSVNLHLHKVSHADIGAKMREAQLVVFGEKKKKKEKKKYK